MVETRTYQLTGYGGTPTAATVTIRSYTDRERVRRALQGLGTFWAAALGSVLIPVLHFLLVPSFAIYGAFAFFSRLGARQVVAAAEGTCPDCGKHQALNTSGRWQVPTTVSCRYCQRSLRVS